MATLPLDAIIPTASGAAGEADAAPPSRLHYLQAELAEIAADREMAHRMHPATTSAWLAELAKEERNCRTCLHEAATGGRRSVLRHTVRCATPS